MQIVITINEDLEAQDRAYLWEGLMFAVRSTTSKFKMEYRRENEREQV